MLADFVAELTLVPEAKEKPKEQWNVWANKASSSNGVRIGAVLEGPLKVKLKYAVKLAFKATNNVAEYKPNKSISSATHNWLLTNCRETIKLKSQT